MIFLFFLPPHKYFKAILAMICLAIKQQGATLLIWQPFAERAISLQFHIYIFNMTVKINT
jgi:hypothetical protein